MFSTQYKFKLQNSFEKRVAESTRICEKYTDRIPIIVETVENSELVLDKTKYLVPHDLSVAQFLYVIRKRIKLAPENALFIFFNGTLPPTSALISSVYKAKKDKDGFLYATVSLESTFG